MLDSAAGATHGAGGFVDDVRALERSRELRNPPSRVGALNLRQELPNDHLSERFLLVQVVKSDLHHEIPEGTDRHPTLAFVRLEKLADNGDEDLLDSGVEAPGRDG